MFWSILAVPIGFVLDLIFGDFHGALGKIHPVVLIGKVISLFEKLFRGMCPKTACGENLAGALVWLLTVDVTVVIACAIVILCYAVSVPLGVAVEAARYMLTGRGLVTWDAIGTGILVILFVLVFGLGAFNRAQRNFVDTI